jgi:hypothetical protein
MKLLLVLPANRLIRVRDQLNLLFSMPQSALILFLITVDMHVLAMP